MSLTPTSEQLGSLDPDTRAMVELLDAQPLLSTMTPAEARARRRAQRAAGPERPLEDVASAQDHLVGLPGRELRLRVYRPAGAPAVAPALVWCHVGGYVLGSIEDQEPLCRQLANRLGAVVIAVDYRLSPEHRFPAAVDDAYDALAYVRRSAQALGVDGARIAVGGDSAGGGLAASVCLRARRLGEPQPAAQLLVYPLVHCPGDLSGFDASLALPPLRVDSLGFFFEHTFNELADRNDEEASPLLADDHSGLAPAVVVTAHFDILRPQVEAYAAALASAGVGVTLLAYPGVVHGFFVQAPLIARAVTAVDEASAALRRIVVGPQASAR